MRLITILFLIMNITIGFGQSKLELETNSSGDDRLLLDGLNLNNGFKSATIFSMSAGTSSNQVTSGIRNFAKSYTAVNGYGGYITFSNDDSGMIFRNENPNGDFRFLVGGFPISSHQKMILDKDGQLGIGVLSAASKLHVKGGDVYLEDIGTGVIMKSPNGTCWRLTVSDLGEPTFSPMGSCPQP